MDVEKSFNITETPVRSAKFIARENWFIARADDKFIRVYNYNTDEKLKEFEAQTDYVRSVTMHPTHPYVLSASDDMLIKLWDLEKDWVSSQVFEGHGHYVMQVAFNSRDNITFASVSLDRTIQMWNLGSTSPNSTMAAHMKGINFLDFSKCGGKTYVIIGSDDHTTKVWDYKTTTCVRTLERHTHNVTAVCVHPEAPIMITGSEDGAICIWNGTTYRIAIACHKGIIMGKVICSHS